MRRPAKHPGLLLLLAAVLLAARVPPSGAAAVERWSSARARAWYSARRWILGSDYVPSDAVNELEMWQAATFDPKRIDVELGWAPKGVVPGSIDLGGPSAAPAATPAKNPHR